MMHLIHVRFLVTLDLYREGRQSTGADPEFSGGGANLRFCQIFRITAMKW